MGDGLGARARLAVAAMRTVNAVSRRTGRGAGTVAGGRVALRVAPGLLASLSTGRQIALVSGTNGKTTTTACVAAALRTLGEVASNATGSNMPPGHVAALAGDPSASFASLEVDEVWLPKVLDEERPRAVLLLNLSRDQLDRTSEVRRVADGWRAALAGFEGVCVANADDPMVVHAASDVANVAFFAGGHRWGDDAVACPRCARRLEYREEGWRCECGFARPAPDAELLADRARVDGRELDFKPALPGSFNRTNALAALLCASRLGADLGAAARAICALSEVAGRFSRREFDGVATRLLLAKNPAGWQALLDMVASDRGPIVIAVNARDADGHDPSWLFDVEFERLAGRRVVASGERWRDLSVRLYYGGVEHEREADPRRAVRAAAAGSGGTVEVIANYTAFAELSR